MYLLVWKGLSNDDVGVAWGIVFQEIRPGASPPEISLIKGGGATVERLHTQPDVCLLKTGNLQHFQYLPTGALKRP